MGLEPTNKGFVPMPKFRGADENRTREYRFCKPMPYHLATAPLNFGYGIPTSLLYFKIVRRDKPMPKPCPPLEGLGYLANS